MSWPSALRHSPEAVIGVAARLSGLPASDIIGFSRERPILTVRHLAMAAAREVTGYGFPAIGRAFGGRDHSTIMHAVQKVKNDPVLSKDCDVLVEEVRRAFGTIRGPGEVGADDE